MRDLAIVFILGGTLLAMATFDFYFSKPYKRRPIFYLLFFR